MAVILMGPLPRPSERDRQDVAIYLLLKKSPGHLFVHPMLPQLHDIGCTEDKQSNMLNNQPHALRGRGIIDVWLRYLQLKTSLMYQTITYQ